MKLRKKALISLACTLALVSNTLSMVVQDRDQIHRKVTPKSLDGQRKDLKVEGTGTIFVDQNGQQIQINLTAQDPQFTVAMSGGNGAGAVFYSPEGSAINFATQDNILVRGQYGPAQDTTLNFISSEMSFDSKPVKGAPFSADVESEMVQTLADGNRIIRRSTGAIYRDSEGRTRRENTINAVAFFAGSDPLRTITINDPVAWVTYSLDPLSRIARKMGISYARVPAPPPPPTLRSPGGSSEPPKKINISGGVLQGAALKKVQPPYPPVAKAAKVSGAVQVQITVSEEGRVVETSVISGHPLLRDAAAQAASQWEFKPTVLNGVPVKVQGVLTFNFTLLDDSKTDEIAPRIAVARTAEMKAQSIDESLGKQIIEGIEAEGKRATTTIPAGAIGNELPIEIVRETWFSPELQTVIYSKHSDPRTGETIYRLTNIRRGEPDASLFQIPSDYTVREPETGIMPGVPPNSVNIRRKPDNQ